LQHPFTPQAIFSEDGVARIHEMALKVVHNLGLTMLLPEARQIFEAAGALVNHDTQMVRIGSDLVEAVLATTPTSYRLRGRSVLPDQVFEDGSMRFAPGAGCPNVTDLVRGRRAGSLETYEETIKLQQSFDVMHVFGPSAEPQDVVPALRHYEMMRIQMGCGDKPNFVYARGRGQVAQNFEMIQLGNDMGAQSFDDDVWCFNH
jgi:trimethylamine--corrinoid protein Co-methyltransferase